MKSLISLASAVILGASLMMVYLVT